METNGLFEAMARIGETITLGSLPEGLQKMVRDTVELEQTRDYGRIMQMRENYLPEGEREEKFRRAEFVMCVKGAGHSEVSVEEIEKVRVELKERMDSMCFSALMSAVIGQSAEEMGTTLAALEQRPPDMECEKEIKMLKKQLKHCKNPMEAKQINQRLNKALKERKKERRQRSEEDS